MERIVSRDLIAQQVRDAVRTGAPHNPYPVDADAHAAWQADYDRLVAALRAVAG